MSAATPVAVKPPDAPAPGVDETRRATPLELFFDLVFVFAITQVTALLAHDPTWTGLARGALVLAAVWWAWAAYAWLTNQVDTDRGGVRLAMFAAMAAMLVASLAIPGAFNDDALLFACAYLAVRVLHILVFAQSSDEVQVRDAVRALAPTAILAPALLLVAAFLDGAAQGALWLVVLLVDYGAAGLRGIEGWRLSPGHFAERHGLIMIIALGESIIAVGVGVSSLEIDAQMVLAAAIGVTIAAALWWAYFDVAALVAERKLHEQPPGRAQNTMARDSYSYLHLPMIAGIVLVALGIKKTLGHVDEPLAVVPAFGVCGGVALYLVAHVAFRVRTAHAVSRPRIIAAGACLGLLPLALEVPALMTLAAVALVCVGLIGYETLRFREARAAVRLGH